VGVQVGYQCEECEEAVWLTTTRSELTWLRNRRHIVKEVMRHVSGGLDTWMMDGMEFLERHEGHNTMIVSKGTG
jgi:hypothetical protein